MSIVNGVVKLLLKERRKDIDYFLNHPNDAQSRIFHYLIRKAKNTEWGLKYDYSSISNVKTFKERLPIQDYDDIKPTIDRILKGEQNIIWDSPIRWLAKSSGTTSDKSKFIPVSKESLEDNHYRGGKDIMAVFSEHFPDAQLYSDNGKGLIIGGSHQISQFSEDVSFGDLSAVLLQNLPMIARYFRAPSLPVALMDEWELKLDMMARETMKDNITFLAGVPSWTIVLFKKILELTGAENMREVWPNLEMYMHGGVNFGPYVDQFKQYLPDNKTAYFQTYNASEGFFSFQDEIGANDMALCLNHGIYFEFMPLSQVDNEYPNTLELHEVELGVNYALIISTNAGLWRYKLGDTVKFTSTYPYRIQVTGRVKHFINAFGEELIIENAVEALTRASAKTGAKIREYTAAPIFFDGAEAGGHEWLIEFEHAPKDLEQFTKFLDQELKAVNSDYEAKRYNDYNMKMPVVNVAPQDLFYNWLKSKGKLGGQHKVPRLSNDRKYLDEIKSFI